MASASGKLNAGNFSLDAALTGFLPAARASLAK
jgi:hypothetical protein